MPLETREQKTPFPQPHRAIHDLSRKQGPDSEPSPNIPCLPGRDSHGPIC
ncbi:hypothetical protein SAMN06265222_117104 [Neorhodopirellula lusitana]|uniref:Uncharacterized protein n=1 Tax=Neorhodopirellula lusitana TaxID=445327 RepID=A0ABY1QND2_9BACT|nr:hypothetical protein SAMN06265222_117104 [Neorhodopirellula lusitana]